MGLCNLCKWHRHYYGSKGAGYCGDRTAESFISCDTNTNFAPFAPKEELRYSQFSREEILRKWNQYIEKENHD